MRTTQHCSAAVSFEAATFKIAAPWTKDFQQILSIIFYAGTHLYRETTVYTDCSNLCSSGQTANMSGPKSYQHNSGKSCPNPKNTTCINHVNICMYVYVYIHIIYTYIYIIYIYTYMSIYVQRYIHTFNIYICIYLFI